MLDTQYFLQHHDNNAKGTKFLLKLAFYTSDAPAKVLPSTTFGLSFMTSSVAPTRSSTTSYAYLITKNIGRSMHYNIAQQKNGG